jgi:hypothetical protein
MNDSPVLRSDVLNDQISPFIDGDGPARRDNRSRIKLINNGGASNVVARSQARPLHLHSINWRVCAKPRCMIPDPGTRRISCTLWDRRQGQPGFATYRPQPRVYQLERRMHVAVPIQTKMLCVKCLAPIAIRRLGHPDLV